VADDFTTATSRIAWLALQIESLGSQYDALGKKLRIGIDPCLPNVDTNECQAKLGFVKTIWTPLLQKWYEFKSEYSGAEGKAKLALRTTSVAEDLNKFEVLLISTALVAQMKGFDVREPEPKVYGPPAELAPNYEPEGSSRAPWVKPVVVGVAVAAGLGFLVMASRQS
jgi:hypothetical protein